MLWFSSRLKSSPKYRRFFLRLAGALRKQGVEYRLLGETADIWCRDYMPVRGAGGEWVQFRYAPGYLRRFPGFRSDAGRVLEESFTAAELTASGLADRRYSRLRLDGGNIILRGRTAIVTERIYAENPGRSRRRIRHELRDLLELERLILLPVENRRIDMTGHVDGICRFIDAERILLGDFSHNPRLGRSIRSILEKEGFETVTPGGSDLYCRSGESWAPYVNFLETPRAVFVPILSLVEEWRILESLGKIFAGREIVPVEAREILREGGALNCVSWEI